MKKTVLFTLILVLSLFANNHYSSEKSILLALSFEDTISIPIHPPVD